MNHNNKTGRAAFLLNTNAKSVTKRLLQKLSAQIPREHLYLSENLKEAEACVETVITKGYAYLFCGGGDGTAITTINLMNEYKTRHPHAHLPKIGVLRLGTGNALARYLGADKPKRDIKAILQGKPITPILLSMIETTLGEQTPFAGIGYDGELMNDFESVKDIFFESPFRKFFSSVFGFTVAGVLKTLPRQIARDLPQIKVSTAFPAYRIKEVRGVDEEIYLDKGQILYEGKAPMISVGTIPWVGYGITLFPFANRRPGYMQLRISAVPLSICLSNIYPSIWHGHFRHKKLYDFLVKDVTIESEHSLPYQWGGDAMGYKKQLYFRVSKEPVAMASLVGKMNGINLPREPLMTPLI